MTTDLLEPFRRGGQPAAPPEPPDQEPTSGYQAYGVASGQVKPQRLDIRAAKGLAVARHYASLSEIAYDRKTYTGIILFFPGKMMTIRGRNLKPVVDALLAGSCEFLQQISEGDQADYDAPVIDEITITAPAAPAAKPAPP